MATTQQQQRIAVRWQSCLSTLHASFKRYLEQGEFTDVTLTAGDGQYRQCHQVIISACSPYFEAVCLAARNEPEAIIIMQDVTFETLNLLVAFMYGNEIVVTHEQLSQLYAAANSYRVKGLDGFASVVAATSQQQQHQQPPPLSPSPVMPAVIISEDEDVVADQQQFVDSQERGPDDSNCTSSTPHDDDDDDDKNNIVDAAVDAQQPLNLTTTARPMTRDERLQKAAEFVVAGGRSITSIADQFEIPRSTLYSYMRRNGIPTARELRQGDNVSSATLDNQQQPSS